MLAMEQGTREKWSVDGEGPRDEAIDSSYRFGASKYVIVRRGNSALEPLRAASPSSEGALPVFATEQTEWRYIRSETPVAGWYVREIRNGESPRCS